MKRCMWLLILVGLLCCFHRPARAQNPVQFPPTTTDPTGRACNSTQGYLLTPSGKLFTSSNGVCAVVGGGGSTTPGGSSGDIQFNNGGVFGGGRCTMDSSQNIVCTGQVTASQFIGSGWKIALNVYGTGETTIQAVPQSNRTNVQILGGSSQAMLDMLDVTVNGHATPGDPNFFSIDYQGFANAQRFVDSNGTGGFCFSAGHPELGFALGSGCLTTWSSTINSYGTKDTGIARNAAGVLEANNGTPGTFRDWKFRALTLTGLAGGGSQCVTTDNNGAIGASGAPCANTVFTATFTNQTSVTMGHNFGTNNLTFACYSAANPPVWIEPNTVTETDTNTLTVTFTNSQSGHCTVVAQGGPGGGGGITGLNVAAPITTTGGTTPTIGINNFGGDSGSGGSAGAVPAPPAGSAAANEVLGAGGAWVTQTSGTSTILIVTGHGNHTTNATVSNEFFSSCDSTSGVVTLSLPAAPSTGELHNLKKIDSSGNPCIINGNGKNIDGGANVPLGSQYTGISVYYDGTQWWVI